MQSNESQSFQMCEPRSYILEPTTSRSQALTRAGAYADKIFRLKSLLRRGKSNVKLLQRRFIPFWNVRCTSHFHYDRASSFSITPEGEDAVEITIRTTDGQTLVLPVNPEAKERGITLPATERCITERDVTESVSALGAPESKAFADRARSIFLRGNQKQYAKYLSGPSAVVQDVAAFHQTNLIDGREPFPDLQDESILVLAPSRAANRVVSEVMKKVLVSIDPVRIHDWSLTVEVADLYFHPVYVFEFERLDKEDNVVETKLGQLDALTGDWTALASLELEQTEQVIWEQLLKLTIDARALILQEVGGAWSDTLQA